MAATLSIVDRLRERIKDDRPVRTAFRLECCDETATDCLAAISTSGRFTTNPLNSRAARPLVLDLTSASFYTIRQLVEHLQQQRGYKVALEQDYAVNHPARDLVLVGSMDLVGQAAEFKHHLYSDDELHATLTNAVARHNVSYTVETVPQNEYEFVLMLGVAMIQRDLAADAAKRRNLEATVSDLLALAQQLEDAYYRDTRRQARAIPVPTFDEDTTKQGDIVIGTFVRRSMRTGYFTPMAGVMAPDKPVLESPSPDDVEDIKVHLRWRRNIDLKFYTTEIWRDTQPNVQRPKGGQLVVNGPNLLRESIKQPMTSRLVFRSFGAHSTRDSVGFTTFVEQAGQLITDWVDNGNGVDSPNGQGSITVTPLEPETTYYYKMYVVSLNFELSESNTVSVTTKKLRVQLEANGVHPTTGPAGTRVTCKGLRFTGLFEGHPPGSITLGGKAAVNPVIVSDTLLSFEVPRFANPAAKNLRYDLVVTSPDTGLIEVYAQVFTYTGP